VNHRSAIEKKRKMKGNNKSGGVLTKEVLRLKLRPKKNIVNCRDDTQRFLPKGKDSDRGGMLSLLHCHHCNQKENVKVFQI